MSSAVEKYNQIAVNQKIEGIENRRAVAQNLLIEAEMLEGEARKKRDRAYTVAPEMAPKTIPTFTAAATAPVRQEVALAAQTSGKSKARVAKAKKAAI
jgi:stress response protein YsnF